MRKKVPDHNTCKSRDIGGSAVHAHERQKEKGGKKKKKKTQRKEKEHISVVLFVMISLSYLCGFERSLVIESINDAKFPFIELYMLLHDQTISYLNL